MRFFILCSVFSLVGCQSVQEKNQDHVRDRISKLEGLSSWSPKVCQVRAVLTQPARARYAEIFPKDQSLKSNLPLEYTWRVRESDCQLTSQSSSELVTSHKRFMDTAFCVLLQTHFVNSPFDELVASKSDLVRHEDMVQIQTGKSPDVGIFLDTKKFTVETHTVSRGAFFAEYQPLEKQWVPSRIEARPGKALIVVEAIGYGDVPAAGRPMIEKFTLSIGEDQVLPHTNVEVSDCVAD